MKRFLLLFLFPLHLTAQSADKLNEQGIKLMGQSKYKEALVFLNKAVAAEPGFTVYRYNRAIALSNLDQNNNAASDYKILIKELPDESEYYFQLAVLYEKMDSLPQASKNYNQAIQLDNKDYKYFFHRGTYYLKKGAYALAILDFSNSIKLNPAHDNSYHNRGIALYKTGLKEKACADWCVAAQKGNPYSPSHLEKNCKQFSKPCPAK